MSKGCVLDAGDEVALEVELAKMDQAIEFKALQLRDLVVLEMKGAKAFQSIECLVLNLLNDPVLLEELAEGRESRSMFGILSSSF